MYLIMESVRFYKIVAIKDVNVGIVDQNTPDFQAPLGIVVGQKNLSTPTTTKLDHGTCTTINNPLQPGLLKEENIGYVSKVDKEITRRKPMEPTPQALE